MKKKITLIPLFLYFSYGILAFPMQSLALEACDSLADCNCVYPNGYGGYCYGYPICGAYCGVTVCGFCESPSTAANAPSNTNTTTPDPVNIFSGETYFSSVDFSLNAVGPKLALSRYYRSSSHNFNGMFGYGWRTDYDANLMTDSSGNVKVFNKEGVEFDFAINPPTYNPNEGNFSTLTLNADNTYTVTDPHGIAAHYHLSGQISTVTDRNGNSLSFVYNPQMPAGAYIQDAAGRRIMLNFDANGHVISAIDPAGKTFQYGYDSNGNLVSVTDPTGAVTTYTYDDNHRITQFTNANGHHQYYQYDSQGRCAMTWQDNNVNKMTLNYEDNNTTVVTDSLGNNNTYVFNSLGLLISHTDPLGHVTQQTWDAFFDLLSVTDANNHVTTYAYNMGNLAQIVDPLGNQTNMTYTPDFNLISTKTDALNHTTSYFYDHFGNLTGMTDPLGNTHSFTYDQYGELVTAKDSRGNSTNFTYDTYGHVIQRTDAVGNTSNFTYE